MITIISPAKTLDFKNEIQTNKNSQPLLLEDSKILIEKLKEYNPQGLAQLMNINNALANLNYERFIKWEPPFKKKQCKTGSFSI